MVNIKDKIMTQEEKAKAYDEAIERAREKSNDEHITSPFLKSLLEDIFPELKESKDEKIKKTLINLVKRNGAAYFNQIHRDDIFAWLEKQGKEVDVIENFDTEFEKQVSHLLASIINKDWEYTEGFVKWASNSLLGYAKHEIEKQGKQMSVWNGEDTEWIESLIHTFEDGYLVGFEQLESYGIIDWLKSLKGRIGRETNFMTTREKNLKKISDNVDPKTEISKDTWYICTSTTCSEDSRIWFNKGTAYLGSDILKYDLGFEPVEYQNYFRLWTIQDAKEGDVLSYVTDEGDLWLMIYWSLYKPYEGHVHYHALLVDDVFTNEGTCCICVDNLKPATKEQRDLLEKAMTDAGYAFDFNEKEFKKKVTD